MLKNLKQFQEELKKTVKGQDKAIETVSTFFFKYLLKLHGKDFGIKFKAPSIMLLRGSSGTGKTFLIEEAAKLSELEFHIINAKSIAQEGWLGNSFKNYIEESIKNSNKKGGIFFIDEFDKIVDPLSSSNSDNVNLGIQASLLKYLEGGMIIGERQTKPINYLDNWRTHRWENHETGSNLSNYMFIFAGAFHRLQITNKAIKPQIGFFKETPTTDYNRFIDNVVEYGMLSELAGRIQEYCELVPITPTVYRQILMNSTDSPLFKWEDLLNKLQIPLELVLDEIIEEAMKSSLGVRGLHQILENKVTEALNKYLENADLSKLDIDYTPPEFKTTPRF